jgi:hypothetical protein
MGGFRQSGFRNNAYSCAEYTDGAQKRPSTVDRLIIVHALFGSYCAFGLCGVCSDLMEMQPAWLAQVGYRSVE